MQAGRLLARRCITRLYAAAVDEALGPDVSARMETAGDLCGGLAAAFRAVIADQQLDAASKALVLSLPSASELISLISNCDPLALHHVCEFLIAALARELRSELEAVIAQFTQCEAASTCVIEVFLFKYVFETA